MHNYKTQWSVTDVAGRLALLRNWLGLSQEEMAIRLRMSPRAYAKWEEPTGEKRRQHSMLFLTTLHGATGVSMPKLRVVR